MLLEQDAEFESEFSSPSAVLNSVVVNTPEPELLASGTREIQSDDPRRRILGIRLMRELKQHGEEAARELSGLLASEQDPEVLYWVVGAFGFLKSDLVTDQLISLAHHPSPGVRYNVATALANRRSGGLPSESVNALLGLTEDENAEVRFSAVFELGSWWQLDHDPRIGSALRHVIASDNDTTVVQAAEEAIQGAESC
ncbi:MAG TPA: HEAT repeat domain-containing protein [Streptosporangiaceae bacterium]|nr:HEAT repeat domain-containing protein [Streptosporangiaceae bacterium]